jgi:putative redox protein
MRINIKRHTAPYHFVATSTRGREVHMDEPPESGGTDQGVSPMQMLIMSMGGCSGIDIAMILEKSRQTVETFDMELDAERPPDTVGQPYHKIHAHYILTGDIDPEKAKRAVKLSINKYCGASKTLEATADISSSVSVNGERFEVDLTP